MTKELKKLLIPDEIIKGKIYLKRDEKVIVDSDLASLYTVIKFGPVVLWGISILLHCQVTQV